MACLIFRDEGRTGRQLGRLIGRVRRVALVPVCHTVAVRRRYRGRNVGRCGGAATAGRELGGGGRVAVVLYAELQSPQSFGVALLGGIADYW